MRKRAILIIVGLVLVGMLATAGVAAAWGGVKLLRAGAGPDLTGLLGRGQSGCTGCDLEGEGVCDDPCTGECTEGQGLLERRGSAAGGCLSGDATECTGDEDCAETCLGSEGQEARQGRGRGGMGCAGR